MFTVESKDFYLKELNKDANKCHISYCFDWKTSSVEPNPF
jgi:hypothetical protein